MPKVFYYLALMRPANVLTAIADILAGVAIAGFLRAENLNVHSGFSVFLLLLATAGLYGGGVVFNDVFDVEQDKIERPERPLPRGIINIQQASIFGAILLGMGILSAFAVNTLAGIVAAAIAVCALFYDSYAKHKTLIGPLVMGCCRALNLLLGMTISSDGQLPIHWKFCFIPLLFIAAITLTSQGEVYGNNKKSVALALVLDLVIVMILLGLAFNKVMNFQIVLPFIGVWFGMNAFAKIRAIFQNKPQNIMRAVKMGVLSLIPLNALYVAGFGGWAWGLAVLCLLPLSMLLAKQFAVT